MKLSEAIQKIVSDNGVEILKERRLVALLSDFKAFDDMQYAKNILKQVYADNFGEQILDVYQSNDVAKANALISNLSDNLGYDEDKLAEIFSGFFPELIAANKEKSTGDVKESTYNDNDADVDTDNSDGYYDSNSEVVESAAETEAFMQFRDRLTDFCARFPQEWKRISKPEDRFGGVDFLFGGTSEYSRITGIKSLYTINVFENTEFVNRIKGTKQVFNDIYSEYELNVSTHRYSNWQLDALNKLKQNVFACEHQVDTLLAEIADYNKKMDDFKMYSEIGSTKEFLKGNQGGRFSKRSESYYELKNQIEKNESLLNRNNNIDNAWNKQLTGLQAQLLSIQKKVDSQYVALPLSVKIIFGVIALFYNYVAFKTGWGWLFLTIPLTIAYYVFEAFNFIKSVQIGVFIALTIIILTIIIPVPWWMVIVAIIASGIYIYMYRECEMDD